MHLLRKHSCSRGKEARGRQVISYLFWDKYCFDLSLSLIAHTDLNAQSKANLMDSPFAKLKRVKSVQQAAPKSDVSPKPKPFKPKRPSDLCAICLDPLQKVCVFYWMCLLGLFLGVTWMCVHYRTMDARSLLRPVVMLTIRLVSWRGIATNKPVQCAKVCQTFNWLIAITLPDDCNKICLIAF